MKTNENIKNKNQRYLIYLFMLLLIILITVIFYFKKILNKPIPTISSLIISNSYAQDVLPQLHKTKIMEYSPLKIDEIIFPINFEIDGFSMGTTKSNPPESCMSMNLFSTKLALLLFKDKSFPPEWKKYIEKCSFELNKSMSAMLEMKRTEFKDIKQLEMFLTPYKFKDKIRKIILSTFVQKRSRVADIVELKRFISVSQQLNSLKDQKKKYFAIENYIEKGEVKNVFFNNLINLNYALSIRNFSWAKSILIDLVYYNRLRYINDVQDHYFNGEEQLLSFQKEFVKTINLAFEKLQYRELIQILINKYNQIIGKKTFEELSEKVSANWSLAEIREKASSITFGRQFPEFWYNQLLERTTKFELESFLQKNLKKRNIELIPIHSYGLFFNYMPKDEASRDLIIKKIEDFSKENNCYIDDMINYLLQSEVIKRRLSKINESYMLGNFNLKRTHHRKCLERGRAVKFHLYSLFKLGDKDENLLWWLVL